MVYSNITNFMKKEGISYSDRVVLQVLLAVVRKGYDVVLFTYKNGVYKQISNQLLSEYFFTKNVLWKNKYALKDNVDINKIKEDDIYFEVDALKGEEFNLEDYYTKLEKTNCQMYSYLYFIDEFDEMNENEKLRLQKHCACMNKIYISEKERKVDLANISKKCLADIVDLEVDLFASEYIDEPFLQVEKGLAQIINEGEFVVNLYDCDNPRLNRGRMSEIRKKYADKKIIYLVPSQTELNQYTKVLEKNRELGKSLFVISGMDYYTILKLYASANVVIVPKHCKSCGLEIINIKNAK